MRQYLTAIAAIPLLLSACGHNRQPSAAAPPPHLAAPATDADRAADLAGLHNVVTYARDLYSGSAPDGDAGFDALRSLGVKTVISVDGAAPDIARAKARGLRYIHLPIGYDGMDHDRTLQIARAVQDAELAGPVYIHCHHGKHRSAGAAGAAAVTLGLLTTDQATARMKVSGTAPNYTGLYRCVAVARRAPPDELAAVSGDFPEVYHTSGLIKTMVEIDDVFEHLKAIEKAGWSVPRDHPDLVPAAEAGRLADLFRNLKDDPQVRAQPEEYRAWLTAASEHAGQIEERLAAPGSPSPAELSAGFKLVVQSCKDCHAKYRD